MWAVGMRPYSSLRGGRRPKMKYQIRNRYIGTSGLDGVFARLNNDEYEVLKNRVKTRCIWFEIGARVGMDLLVPYKFGKSFTV
jgi:hypothetical protein